MLTDRELLQRIQERDEDAFALFFERYSPPIRGYLLRIVQDAAAAEDLVQEVFWRVWSRSEQWSGQGAARAWLYRIAANLALNSLRAAQRRAEQPLEPASHSPQSDPDSSMDEESLLPAWMVDTSTLGPDAALETADESHLLQRLIGELPEEKREVFQRVAEMEMSIRQAAVVFAHAAASGEVDPLEDPETRLMLGLL